MPDEQIPMLAGEPMVCEQHFWRLWPDNDGDCPGPGMTLSGAEGYQKQLDRLRESLAAVRRRMVVDHYTGTAPDSARYWVCRICAWLWKDGESENHDPTCPLLGPPAPEAKEQVHG